MPIFKFVGDQQMTFPSITNPATGSTLVMDPGDTLELDADPGVPNLINTEPKPDPLPETVGVPPTVPSTSVLNAPEVEEMEAKVAELQAEIAQAETPPAA
jgi:hypothetical protein